LILAVAQILLLLKISIIIVTVYFKTTFNGKAKYYFKTPIDIFFDQLISMDKGEAVMSSSKSTTTDKTARNENLILAGINKVFREAMTCETIEELGVTCLAVAEELTGSHFGFIGERNFRGRMDTLAISNPGWDECVVQGSDKTQIILDMEVRGIWAGPLLDGKSAIINDPPNHPDSVGTPEGHPPLKSLLVVALMDRDTPYGIIAVANKEGGYTSADQKAIESLSVAVVESFRNKRAELELARKSQDILELSTPIIQLWKGIILAPLIGILDSQRTKLFLERFLNYIVEYSAHVALIDITGVPTIDTQTAHNLIEAFISAKLLGAKVVLTGVRPSIAQTMIHLGIDLEGIETKSSLMGGVRIAYKMMGLEVKPMETHEE
jgi:anti-anti-sigma regulatory factor